MQRAQPCYGAFAGVICGGGGGGGGGGVGVGSSFIHCPLPKPPSPYSSYLPTIITTFILPPFTLECIFECQTTFLEGLIEMSADPELSNILSRRQRINEDLDEGKEVKKQYRFVNVYTEFHELSRREIKRYEQTFNR
ncbi:hypothetical protein M0802_010495 [Mischocyttarus mexicanus]|nr:hypothetical protein M0802_010495 [Mischocyttarus mexicanus]